MRKINERITTIAAVVAATTGVAGLFLAIAIDTSPVRDWEIWDWLRIEGKEDTTLVVARLRNDNESRYTEELLEWIDEGGKQYEELGRTWKRQKDIREGQRKLRKLFERTAALVLVEGYVGPEGTVLQMWGKGASKATEVHFSRTEEDRTEAMRRLDEVVVSALQTEATEKALRMGEDPEYTKMQRRLKQAHQEVGNREAKRGVEFATAYVENIRADKKGSEEKGQRAIRIYESLLQYPENDKEKAMILTNLGIAEFRVARTKGKAEAAKKAIQRWSEAERLATDAGWVAIWISSRNFQTEGELWIEQRNRDGRMAIQAWKRQVETLADTHTVIGELTALKIQMWLERARKAAIQNSDDGCKFEPELIVGDIEIEGRSGDGCEQPTRWQWSRADFERRLKRTERWINLARREGHDAREVGLIGVRANLLRNRGIETKEPALLISSFAGTHEFRTRTGIIDQEIEKGELVLIIDPVLRMVELEAEIALTCADRQYIETLVTEIGGAQLWCPRSSPVECNGRPNWKNSLVAALEFAIGQRMGRTTEENIDEHWGTGSKRVWSLAEHAKEWIESGRVKGSLCPNRPQGITESEEDTKEKIVNMRTRKYQRVERTVMCKLPERDWTVAPNVPVRHDEMARWRQEIDRWIDRSYKEVDQDVQTIRECEGEPE